MTIREEKVLGLATLIFPVKDDNVMLGLKMKKIGKGCLNGWGGGVEVGESIEECACREFFEETGGVFIRPENLQKIGIVHFKNNKSDGTVFVCTVHVYKVKDFAGKIVSTEEMKDPKWFKVSLLSSLKLMPADYFWLERMLSGETGIVHAEYGPYQKTLIGGVDFKPVIF